MSALAKLLFRNGYKVSGSDRVKSETTETLSYIGIPVFIGVDENRSDLFNADVVVYTDAIPPTNTEFLSARRLEKVILSRAELLQAVSRSFKNVIGVAGSHGKTTCTAMCAHVLKTCQVSFTAHIGGEDSTFGNFYSDGTEFLVTECCEYKRNMLKLQPTAAALLNIDCDHMECYNGEEDLQRSFYTFCKSAKTAFVCADDTTCANFGEFSTFGIKNPLADYRAIDIRANGERYSFTVEEYGNPLCRVKLNAIGKCNVYNALAAFSLMRSFGFNEKEISEGIATFTAVKRRFEKMGVLRGATVVCDYAHHPRELISTISTAKGICKGKLYVVFQPHTYSRTRLLMKDFVKALRPVDNLLIYKTYPAREKYDEEGSALRLSQNIGNCLYAENTHVLKTWLKKTVKEGDIVLFLGAGDIYYVAQYIIKRC